MTRSRFSDTALRRLTAESVAALVDAVSGPVLTPGDERYAAECASYNLALSMRPAVVVGVKTTADVQAAVRFANDNALPVAVQATGHGQAVSGEGSLLVTTGRMTGVEIDPAARTVWVQAGVRWQQVVDEAAKYGLAPLNGSSPTVGVVGYTLGGGLSPSMGRAYGYAVDHVVSVDVVTADGELRTVSESVEPDLFWALRGGKGNFGVVTAIEFELFEVSRLYGGALFFPGAMAPAVVRTWRDLTAAAPEALSSSFAVMNLPPLPQLPEPLRGQFVVAVRIAFLGSAAAGEALVAPLRALGSLLLDAVGGMPYTAAAAIHADPIDPLPVYERSAQLTGLPDEAVDLIVELTGPLARVPLTMVEVRHLGGALSRPPVRANAVGNRDAEFQIFAAGVGGPPDAAAITGQQDAILTALAPWDNGGTLLNFLSFGDADPQRVRTAYPADVYQRLALIKATWDPANIFRVNHNIVPAS